MNRVLVNGKSYVIAASYKPAKNPRGRCSHCGRWIGTFQKDGENQLRARGHKSYSGAGTFADPKRLTQCPGAGQLVAV